MAKLLKLRGGTTSQHGSFTGEDREVTVDTDKETLVVHDGSTAGGFPLLRNLVEDTTPQLGGDLDLNGNDLTGSGAIPSANLVGALPAISGANLTGVQPFPSGTKMLFNQTSAPTGWTKLTVDNDKALRITTGTVGTGGSVAFSTALGSGATVAGGSVSGNPTSNLSVSVSGNIANTTLSTSQIPSHSHTNVACNVDYWTKTYHPGASGGSQGNVTSANTGGSASHNHGHNLSGSLSGNITAGNIAVGASTATINVQYVDVIIASKD